MSIIYIGIESGDTPVMRMMTRTTRRTTPTGPHLVHLKRSVRLVGQGPRGVDRFDVGATTDHKVRVSKSDVVRDQSVHVAIDPLQIRGQHGREYLVKEPRLRVVHVVYASVSVWVCLCVCVSGCFEVKDNDDDEKAEGEFVGKKVKEMDGRTIQPVLTAFPEYISPTFDRFASGWHSLGRGGCAEYNNHFETNLTRRQSLYFVICNVYHRGRRRERSSQHRSQSFCSHGSSPQTFRLPQLNYQSYLPEPPPPTQDDHHTRPTPRAVGVHALPVSAFTGLCACAG